MTIPLVSLFFKNTSAFTLVELLVAITILTTISIVAFISYAEHVKIADNATRIETIDFLHLSLSDYYQMKKTLPSPNSNFISYDEKGTYMHSLSGAYGISGYVSNDFLPKGYVNFPATDPESNQFYGYGKLADSTAFDLAAVLYDEVTGGYKAYVRGTYQKTRLSSLIRAYSSSAFVSQDSREDLPYNPYQRKVNASISNYSGSVLINSDPTRSLTGELNPGDTITVGTGGSALLHISDGSELSLGSTTSETVLRLDTLKYSDDHNLSSQVALWLRSGEVWTEAPHLRSETDSASDFSIRTDTAVAAVRGTVFGVSQSSTGETVLSLASGKLEVAKFDDTGKAQTMSSLLGKIQVSNGKSYMSVTDGGTPIQITVRPSKTGISTTGTTITPSKVKEKIQHPPFSLGYRPKATSIAFTGIINPTRPTSQVQTGTLSVTFDNPGADSYELSFGTGEVTDQTVSPGSNPNMVLTGSLDATKTLTTITGAFVYIPNGVQTQRTYTLRVCFRGHCSAPDIKHLGGETFAFDNFRVWGEKTPLCTAIQGICESNLVAYAPYDSGTGNLRMYTKNSSIAGTGTGNISGSGAGSVKGIFIGTGSNTQSGGSLKYTLDPNLLGSNFSIEMSVRGGALKRDSNGTTISYNLFDSDSAYVDVYDGAYNPPVLKLWYHNLGFKNVKEIQLGSIFNSLTNNDFYKIKADFNGSAWNLTIRNWNNAIIATWVDYTWSPSFRWTAYSVTINSNLFIGSSITSTNQWNDIIDSVKIYKY